MHEHDGVTNIFIRFLAVLAGFLLFRELLICARVHFSGWGVAKRKLCVFIFVLIIVCRMG